MESVNLRIASWLTELSQAGWLLFEQSGDGAKKAIAKNTFAEAVGLGLVGFALTQIAPLLHNRAPSAPTVSVDLAQHIPWYAPFLLLLAGVSVLFLAKRIELSIITEAFEAQQSIWGELLTENAEECSPRLERKLRQQSAKVLRRLYICVLNTAKLAGCLLFFALVNSSAVAPPALALAMLACAGVAFSRAGAHADGDPGNPLYDLVTLKLRLKRAALAFSNLMPVFLFVALALTQAYPTGALDPINLVIVSLIVNYAGRCANLIAQSMIRVGDAGESWKDAVKAIDMQSSRHLLEAINTARDIVEDDDD